MVRKERQQALRSSKSFRQQIFNRAASDDPTVYAGRKLSPSVDFLRPMQVCVRTFLCSISL